MGELGCISRFSAKFVDKLILPSETMSEHINTNYELVPFGIDLQKFYPMSKTKCRAKISWSEKKNIILFPYSKHRSVKNYSLATNIVDSLNITAELKSISEIPYSKMPMYINASDAVLITSERESGPMVIKEAAACNTPVVSVDVGFASEVLANVRHSHVSDNKDELIQYLSRILDQKFRSDGRQYSQSWGMGRMGRQLIEIYSDIVN
ncbi:glycosyltransferase [Halorubrum sp. GN11GM_10-3_MGM]|uniref:glycosyltransferase n=1 Tax=Halorubrum sp. GN11GM_10-3_MGM TaxID=2518111 RepID=UPI0013051AE5|nr:glycosyltransferase [Halorubrum sp. GN11GM_10-3_MGM]